MKYLISYDLNTPGKDYKRLYDALASIGAKRILLSQWAVRRDGTTCAQIRDALWALMDSNDRLLVMEVGAFAANNLMTKLGEV
jgi:hypothetical protein